MKERLRFMQMGHEIKAGSERGPACGTASACEAKAAFTAGSWFLIIIFTFALAGCSSKDQNVAILYTSQDQVYAEPIIEQFENQTGIDIRAVYDSEAVKTVGLVNRLLIERKDPKCDVFWSNEELHTRQLAAQDVIQKNGWTTTCFRTRRIVINTNLISAEEAPKRFQDFTNSVWRGKFVLAYPQFGTTGTHFIALRELWGKDAWLDWCRALRANEPMMVDGNSVVVKQVGAGEVPMGFTDSDDIAAGQREGLPVSSLPVPDDSLLIHNTVALVNDGPHPETAKRLFDYLSSPEVSRALVSQQAAEGGEIPENVRMLNDAEWKTLIDQLDEATKELSSIFLR